jgi:hypothetical protein
MQCYRYLLVDCVHKGPVHPLLELPPPKNPISIPLPGNIGVYSVINTCKLCTEGACTSTTGTSTFQRSHRSRAHTTLRRHGIIQCYTYLLVDYVQKGPVHPLLELPPPIDTISLPLPGNMGLYSYRYLLVDCVQKGPVHPLQELPPPIDPMPIPLPENMGLYSVIDTYL